MTSVAWKLRRLRAMAPAEVAHRAIKTVHAALEKHGVGLARPPSPRGTTGRVWVSALPDDVDVAAYCSAADSILDGRFDVFAMRSVELGFPPPWNRNPLNGLDVPLVFGKGINYRDERLVGDIKYLWEPNRHLELVRLAQAWHLTGDTRYLDGCAAVLDSWLQACPYPLGPNWTSSLEHGLRLVNWAVAWHLLGGEQSQMFAGDRGSALRNRWLESIYCHCHFISGHLSRHSSANNHLLGELMGLCVATVTWPLWPEARAWHELAYDEFSKEALKQNTSDGVNREQAIWYQHEVLDMMLLVALFARANSVEVPVEYWKRLESMLEFIASIMDVRGNVPRLGDADDAVIVRFSPSSNFDVYRSLLATGALLFQREDFKAKAGELDDKTLWLLGSTARADWVKLPSRPAPPRLEFAEGGYFILGDDFGGPSEVRIVADAAPLGYLSIAAHGHADALAFTMSVRGHEVLVDAGTYAYHTRAVWREYFRGTSAHNTIRIDGENQSVSGGNFLWLRKAAARCTEHSNDSDADSWVAEHDGYQRFTDPVTHRRSLRFSKSARVLTVVDTIVCAGHHLVEQFWHFSEGIEVHAADDGVVAAIGEVSVRLRPDANMSVEVFRGDEHIPLGWTSRQYDIRNPSPTVRCSSRIYGSTTFTTHFQI